jgi:hypothetical protein
MIEEDLYWRADLTKFSERLKKRYAEPRWSKRSLYEIEKDVFLSAYVIRKLIQSGKVDRAVSGLNYRIKQYPIKPGAVPSTNPKTFTSTYDIYRGHDQTLSVEKLCDQFVHSYIFSPLIINRSHGVVFGIYFASDRESKRGLYYISLVRVIEIIVCAARNCPVKLALARKAEGTFKVKCV